LKQKKKKEEIEGDISTKHLNPVKNEGGSTDFNFFFPNFKCVLLDETSSST
jgi:hypothetical protein